MYCSTLWEGFQWKSDHIRFKEIYMLNIQYSLIKLLQSLHLLNESERERWRESEKAGDCTTQFLFVSLLSLVPAGAA